MTPSCWTLSRHLLAGAGLLILAPFTSYAWPVNPEAEREFERAAGAFQSGQFETAAAEARNFLRQFSKHPKSAAARYLEAESLFRQDRWPEAAESFRTAFREADDVKDTWIKGSARLRLGECHFQMKKYLNALDHFAAVEKMDNRALRAEALIGSAYSYLARGEHAKAEIYLVRLLQSYPGYNDQSRVIVPLALIDMERGDFHSAVDKLTQCPTDPASLYYRGVCRRLMGQAIASAQLFKELLDADQGKPWRDAAYFEMGEAYFETREWSLAHDAYQKVAHSESAGDLKPLALFRLGCVNVQSGAYGRAAAHWGELIKDYPQSLSRGDGEFLLAEIALRQNELSQALTAFSALGSNPPYAMDAQFKVLWILAAQGQHDMVVAKSEAFLKDFEWGDLHARVSLLKGYAQRAMSKTDDALRTFQYVLDRFPQSPYADKALYLMAVTLVEARRYAETVTQVYASLKTAPATPTRWQAETYYWVGEAYYNLGQFELARQTYDVVVKNYRDSSWVPASLLGEAASLSRLGRYEEAEEKQALARSLSDESSNPDVKKTALLDSADVLFNQRSYQKAASFYEEFVRQWPDDVRVDRALFQAGQALYRLEFFTEAINKWTTLAERFRQSQWAPEATFQAGRTYFGLGQYPQAYQMFRKVVEFYPQSPLAKEADLQMGQCHYNAGDIPRAVDHYKAFLEKYPKDEKTKEVQDLLQMALYKQGRSGGDMTRLMEQFPKSKFNADIFWELGAEAYNRKDYDKALDYFQRLVLDFPDSTQALQAYYYKADAYYLKGDYSSAVTAYRNFLVNYPQDTLAKEAKFKLAVALFSLKDYGQAAVAFNAFHEAYPSDPRARDAVHNIPLCHAKAGQIFQALDAYDAFLRLFPNDEKRLEVLLQKGQLYEQAEDFAKAVDVYKSVPKDQPEGSEALFALGRCYEKLKAPTERKAALEALRAFNPRDDKFRLAGLVLLAETYEKENAKAPAVEIYRDIASHSTNAEWRSLAQQRVKELTAAP